MIKSIECKRESLEALKKLKSLKAEIRALTEQAQNEQKALLEGFGLSKGENADIVNGNGQLVATFKTSKRGEFVVPEAEIAKLTIKVK